MLLPHSNSPWTYAVTTCQLVWTHSNIPAFPYWPNSFLTWLSTNFPLQPGGLCPLSNISPVQPEVHLALNHKRSVFKKENSGPHCSYWIRISGGGAQESECLTHDFYSCQSSKIIAFNQCVSQSMVLRPAASASPGNSEDGAPQSVF